MKIEVNKNELERALIALGKLISRMSPVPEHKSLLIECKDGKVCFSTRSPSEQMTFRTACAGEVEFRCIVGFDEFRDAVRGYRNKVLEIEDNEGTLRVGERTLFPMSGVEWRGPRVAEGLCRSVCCGISACGPEQPAQGLAGDQSLPGGDHCDQRQGTAEHLRSAECG
mgnify:CR=1 FL=1